MGKKERIVKMRRRFPSATEVCSVEYIAVVQNSEKQTVSTDKESEKPV